MIRYTLNCDKAHSFEAWFRDSTAYEDQRKNGAVTCPACGSSEVSKALMAPAVKGSKKKAEAETVPLATADPRKAEVVEALRRLKQHVMANAEYVGERFPEEARKIHYEESDPRAIYGEASVEEAHKLIEEGVEVAPLPVLPDERN
jgi:hypothetical protein